VQRPERIQRLEDQQVERALQDLSLGLWLTGHANDLSPRTLDRQMKVRRGVVAKRPSRRGASPFGRNGGRAWWAHFEFTRMNIELTILLKKIEDLCEADARCRSHSTPRTIFAETWLLAPLLSVRRRPPILDE
jgi:hypothetical protein